MLNEENGWKLDTVRFVMCLLACLGGIGAIAYIGLAVSMKCRYYIGVNIEKP